MSNKNKNNKNTGAQAAPVEETTGAAAAEAVVDSSEAKGEEQPDWFGSHKPETETASNAETLAEEAPISTTGELSEAAAEKTETAAPIEAPVEETTGAAAATETKTETPVVEATETAPETPTGPVKEEKPEAMGTTAAIMVGNTVISHGTIRNVEQKFVKFKPNANAKKFLKPGVVIEVTEETANIYIDKKFGEIVAE